MTSIKFYEPNEPFYEFSNFFGKNGKKKYQFEIDGYNYMNVEQYFQAQKFMMPESSDHMAYVNIICSADSPSKIFMLGQQKCKYGYASKWVINKKTNNELVNDVIENYSHISIRPNWDTIKVDVMKCGLIAKFNQNPTLRELLLSTGSNDIIENSPRDSFWGVGKDGNGENMLGKLLMEVRELTM